MGIFLNDPWWLILIKVVALFVILLVWTIFNVWYERRLVAKMQHRIGPIMNGPFGLLQAVADGSKLINYTTRKPLGVVASISPWNLPILSLTWKAAPALISGQSIRGSICLQRPSAGRWRTG